MGGPLLIWQFAYPSIDMTQNAPQMSRPSQCGIWSGRTRWAHGRVRRPGSRTVHAAAATRASAPAMTTTSRPRASERSP
jgi:hypothetical protein